MKFSSKEDINAPIDQVFEILSDFELYERSALRRGIDVQRVDQNAKSSCGTIWVAAFSMRGKQRKLDILLSEFNRPNDMNFQFKSPGIEGYLSLELVAMSRTRTRLAVALELKPQNLSARLLIQSLRLAKSNLTNRFKLRVAEFAKTVENRHEAKSYSL